VRAETASEVSPLEPGAHAGEDHASGQIVSRLEHEAARVVVRERPADDRVPHRKEQPEPDADANDARLDERTPTQTAGGAPRHTILIVPHAEEKGSKHARASGGRRGTGREPPASGCGRQPAR